MTFTDDDLKRLKELATLAESSGWSMDEETDFNHFFYEHFYAVLARLEAAEKFAENAWEWMDSGDDKIVKQYEVWRKAAGK